MKTRQGYVQGYNAQAVVSEEQIIVAVGVTQEANDVQQLEPMLQTMAHTLEAAGIEDRPKAGLAAIRTTDGFRIAELGSTKWSNVVHPERFAEGLIKANNARGGRVVPVIKLAKAIADCFIKDSSRKISGYHMESLAIDAFRNYRGQLDPRPRRAVPEPRRPRPS